MKDHDYYFTHGPTEAAKKAFDEMTKRYGQARSPARAVKALVSLGGDGQTLKTSRLGIRHHKPVMSFNLGHVGYLGNEYKADMDLDERVAQADAVKVSPLRVRAHLQNGKIKEDFAINEVHVCHHNQQEGIHMSVKIDGIQRVPDLGADGLLIATSVGSTGYNKSAWGPVLPLGYDAITFTPNNAFMPDRMRACVLRPVPIEVDIINAKYRKADVIVDNRAVGRNVTHVEINIDHKNQCTLLFNPEYTLSEKVMRTQFPDLPGLRHG